MAALALAQRARGDAAGALDRLAAALDAGRAGRLRARLPRPGRAAGRAAARAGRPPAALALLARLLTAFGAGPAPADEAPPATGTSHARRYAVEAARAGPAARHPARRAPAARPGAGAGRDADRRARRRCSAQLARHLTNKEIAAELSISPLTVKRHVSNLCGKLGAGTRRQAVAIAAALGLVPPRSAW